MSIARKYCGSLLLLTLGCVYIVSALKCENAATYYSGVIGKTGNDLKDSLHILLQDEHNPGSYGQAFIDLQEIDEDPNNSNNVITIYSGSQPKCASSGQGCPLSREHLWPTSLGVGGGGKDYRDRFELRIEVTSVNTARSNKRFEMLLDSNGNCKPQFSGCKTPGNPNALADTASTPGSAQNGGLWTPPAKYRGDIARSIFYMAVRYEGEVSSTSDLEFSSSNLGAPFFGSLSTLLLWNQQDPPDDEEKLRNEKICLNQGNRNPFIDFPEWADCIFGSGSCTASPCTGFCGGQSPDGCYCDQLCTSFNDCCPGFNFEAECASPNPTPSPSPSPPPPSPCSGLCGQQSPTGCYCDQFCSFYNDCCLGFVFDQDC